MSRILVVVERFFPEDFLVNDLVAAWKRRGEDVEVLTQVPSYPFDRIYDGYENRRLQTTVEYLGDPGAERQVAVRVHRVSTLFGYNRSTRRKVLNYLHFAWRTFWWAVWRGRRYDRVFVYHTAALTMASSALALRGIWRRPVTIWTQDLWPDAVWGYGFRRTKLRERLLNFFVRRIYAACTRIAVSSPGFQARIRELTGREAEWVPQWDPAPLAANPELDLVVPDPDKPLVFLFAGNLGKPQNLRNDIEGFLRAHVRGAELWIVGGGVMLEPLREEFGEFVRFFGSQPRAEMPAWFAKADALVISLTDDYRLTLPAKFQSYVKTGKPLLGFISGAAKDLIDEHRLGWTAAPDDPDAIAAAYRRAAEEIRAGHARDYGFRAQGLSGSVFDRDRLVARLLQAD